MKQHSSSQAGGHGGGLLGGWADSFSLLGPCQDMPRNSVSSFYWTSPHAAVDDKAVLFAYSTTCQGQ